MIYLKDLTEEESIKISFELKDIFERENLKIPILYN